MENEKTTSLQETNDEEVRLPVYQSEEGLGEILINSEVIERIAAIAALEVEGVSLGNRAGLADTIARLGRKEQTKGVHVNQNESGGYSIVCEVRMAFGIPMRETAIKLQRQIRDSVQRMTGLTIDSVDVKIIDIIREKKDREESED